MFAIGNEQVSVFRGCFRQIDTEITSFRSNLQNIAWHFLNMSETICQNRGGSAVSVPSGLPAAGHARRVQAGARERDAERRASAGELCSRTVECSVFHCKMHSSMESCVCTLLDLRVWRNESLRMKNASSFTKNATH